MKGPFTVTAAYESEKSLARACDALSEAGVRQDDISIRLVGPRHALPMVSPSGSREPQVSLSVSTNSLTRLVKITQVAEATGALEISAQATSH